MKSEGCAYGGRVRHRMGSIASATGDGASEGARESEREDEGTMRIYNAIQRGAVGVNSVARWEGPHMAALKPAAAAAPKAAKRHRKLKSRMQSTTESSDCSDDHAGSEEVAPRCC